MNKILFVKLGAIGDVILTTPVIQSVKVENPEFQIDFLVGKWASQVLEGNPFLNKIISIDERIFYDKHLLPLLKLWFKLKKEEYTCLYLFHRHCFYKYYFRFLADTSYLPKRNSFKKGEHHTKIYLKIAGHPTHSNLQPKLFSSKSIEFQSDTFFIGINPGGGSNPGESVTVRQWPKDYYVRLIKKLKSKLQKITFVFTGGDNDIPLVENIIAESGLDSDSYINKVGKTSLLELYSLIETFHVFLTGDTGGMHIASATENPWIFVLFGPTDPKEKAPLHPKCHVFYNPPSCSPCYHGQFKGCIYSKPICMDQISVEEVYDKLSEKLQLSLLNIS